MTDKDLITDYLSRDGLAWNKADLRPIKWKIFLEMIVSDMVYILRGLSILVRRPERVNKFLSFNMYFLPQNQYSILKLTTNEHEKTRIKEDELVQIRANSWQKTNSYTINLDS